MINILSNIQDYSEVLTLSPPCHFLLCSVTPHLPSMCLDFLSSCSVCFNFCFFYSFISVSHTLLLPLYKIFLPLNLFLESP